MVFLAKPIGVNAAEWDWNAARTTGAVPYSVARTAKPQLTRPPGALSKACQMFTPQLIPPETNKVDTAMPRPCAEAVSRPVVVSLILSLSV
jgi:hypothetical protein